MLLLIKSVEQKHSLCIRNMQDATINEQQAPTIETQSKTKKSKCRNYGDTMLITCKRNEINRLCTPLEYCKFIQTKFLDEKGCFILRTANIHKIAQGSYDRIWRKKNNESSPNTYLRFGSHKTTSMQTSRYKSHCSLLQSGQEKRQS